MLEGRKGGGIKRKKEGGKKKERKKEDIEKLETKEFNSKRRNAAFMIKDGRIL